MAQECLTASLIRQAEGKPGHSGPYVTQCEGRTHIRKVTQGIKTSQNKQGEMTRMPIRNGGKLAAKYTKQCKRSTTKRGTAHECRK